ncbi:glycoside hydrolase family 16 protein [Athelia psychrophila]|uniref:Glycoside hydrolase family 16 protein n=1 Tax=Athelia psychrophila TaxID=1759441 RepID=A0A166IV10_9AGAM|nr:glycoside hydrolase family 16 protein [Fibularhizoctonia sp. CBS 109695]
MSFSGQEPEESSSRVTSTSSSTVSLLNSPTRNDPRLAHAPLVPSFLGQDPAESSSRVTSTASSRTSLVRKSTRSDPRLAWGAPATHSPSSTASGLDGETPYTAGARSKLSALASEYSLSPDVSQWGFNVSPAVIEADDELHTPDDPKSKSFGRGTIFSDRGWMNLGCLIILSSALMTLFIGYPLISYIRKTSMSDNGGFNLGGTNGTGQVPSMGNWGLIDIHTPQSAYTTTSLTGDGTELDLVFSDEFNTAGRTFYPGDDPYWEAVDLHYWATNNLEWYDPAAITTENGSLVITLSEKQTHGLDYQGGMLQTWNKFCFTGGYIEASVSLPGVNNIQGFWPAIWTMGNLGRAGYGATLEGMWPYVYDACDVGTVANQSVNGVPAAASVGGSKSVDYVLSYLPGQRLSRCSCPGSPHPGPMHSDGTYVGRSAPEIDMFEAQMSGTPLTGQVSQSAQWAPFDAAYIWANSSANEIIFDTDLTALNTYIGGDTQQATSGVTEVNQECYEGTGGQYGIYGFEYVPGFDNAYITWIANGAAAWTLNVAGMGANSETAISARAIPQEPMYLIMNLGMSKNFGTVDLANLPFPAHMLVDYIRVYQPKGSKNVGCDPPDFPTAGYINEYSEAYSDPNLTTWRDGFGQPFPNNSFLGQC